MGRFLERILKHGGKTVKKMFKLGRFKSLIYLGDAVLWKEKNITYGFSEKSYLVTCSELDSKLFDFYPLKSLHDMNIHM